MKGKIWPRIWFRIYPHWTVGSKSQFFLPSSIKVFGLIFARNGKIGFGFLVHHPIRVDWSIAIFSQLFGFKNHGFQPFFLVLKHYFNALIGAWQNTISTYTTSSLPSINTIFYTFLDHHFQIANLILSLSFFKANTLYDFRNQELGFNGLSRLFCLTLTHMKYASAASRITAPAIKPQWIRVSTERDGADRCQ